MSAARRGSRLIIEISDDGRGIDRDKVRQAAIKKKLIDADAALTDEETDNLIFFSGLSTAGTVSNISGRGAPPLLPCGPFERDAMKISRTGSYGQPGFMRL
jgi:chemotaxis protein histidine kinase CheA